MTNKIYGIRRKIDAFKIDRLNEKFPITDCKATNGDDIVAIIRIPEVKRSIATLSTSK